MAIRKAGDAPQSASKQPFEYREKACKLAETFAFAADALRVLGWSDAAAGRAICAKFPL
jgi:hypothetical protein